MTPALVRPVPTPVASPVPFAEEGLRLQVRSELLEVRLLVHPVPPPRVDADRGEPAELGAPLDRWRAPPPARRGRRGSRGVGHGVVRDGSGSAVGPTRSSTARWKSVLKRNRSLAHAHAISRRRLSISADAWAGSGA